MTKQEILEWEKRNKDALSTLKEWYLDDVNEFMKYVEIVKGNIFYYEIDDWKLDIYFDKNGDIESLEEHLPDGETLYDRKSFNRYEEHNKEVNDYILLNFRQNMEQYDREWYVLRDIQSINDLVKWNTTRDDEHIIIDGWIGRVTAIIEDGTITMIDYMLFNDVEFSVSYDDWYEHTQGENK